MPHTGRQAGPIVVENSLPSLECLTEVWRRIGRWRCGNRTPCDHVRNGDIRPQSQRGRNLGHKGNPMSVRGLVHRSVRLWRSLIRKVDSLTRASDLYSRGSPTAWARPRTGNGPVHDGNAFRCQVSLAHTMPRRYTRLATPRWGINRRLSPPVFIGSSRVPPPRPPSRPPPSTPHADGLGESADFARCSRLQLSNH